MASEFADCPNCRARIALVENFCPYCKRPVDKCRNCGFFLYPGQMNCVRCRAFVAMEPRIECKAWIEGGLMIGDPTRLKLHIENTGNIPTDAMVSVKTPENVKPGNIEEVIRNLVPWAPVQKAFELTIDTPGEYLIDEADVSFTKSSKEKEVIRVKPVKFIVHGRPIIQVELDGEEDVNLGEENDFHITLKNTGTAPALSSKVDIIFSTAVQILNPVLVHPELAPEEETTAVIKLLPLFTGSHTVTVKAVYTSPQISHIAPMTFESASKTINLNVQKKKR